MCFEVEVAAVDYYRLCVRLGLWEVIGRRDFGSICTFGKQIGELNGFFVMLLSIELQN